MKSPQRVLITGAGSGLGQALAHRFAAAGAQVACVDIHLDRVQATMATLTGEGHAAYAADVGSDDAMDALAESVLANWGVPDVLINNASSFFPTPIGSSSDADWDVLFDANARAPFFLSQTAAPHLARYKGCIVNLLDIFAERPKPAHTVYCMAKAAQGMLTKSLALELAPDVRVNAIAPGGTNTNIVNSFMSLPADADYKIMGKIMTPMDQAEPDEMANLFAFIASNEGRYMTGSIVVIDGGITC